MMPDKETFIAMKIAAYRDDDFSEGINHIFLILARFGQKRGVRFLMNRGLQELDFSFHTGRIDVLIC